MALGGILINMAAVSGITAFAMTMAAWVFGQGRALSKFH
tara:strand:+ start:114 stop:230 length:117 start_codon:yes stop_codon:yes gene_type:complete